MDEIRCVGSLDIGGTKIACGIIRSNGDILAQEVFPTAPERGADQQLHRAAQSLQNMQTQLGLRIPGIGIGCTGPVDPFTGRLGEIPFLPGWKDFGVVDFFAEHLSIPAFLENDADAAMLGEVCFGAGKECSSFIVVTLGTGIGGGILLDGKLYRGAGGAHPEIGHMIVHAGGRACSCGGNGCWETYCGGQGLAEWVEASYPQPFPMTAAYIFQQAASGQSLYQRAVEEFCSTMGIGLANLVTLFAPQRIALTGGLMKSQQVFWNSLLRETRRRCHLVPADTTQLVHGQLGDYAGLVGAAAIFFTRQESQ